MKTNIRILIAVIGIATFTSCSDFLNVNPADALPPEDALTEQSDLDKSLNGSYYSLTKTSLYGRDFIVRGEVCADDVQSATQAASRTVDYYRFVHRVNNSPEKFWSEPYKIINNVNTLLKVIDSGKIPDTKELKNSKGEALAIRALCYFDLLRTYGAPYMKDNGASLGVSLTKEVLSENALPKRNTVAEGYAMILEDLEEAKNLISEEINYGHFNRWAVKAFLARVNMYKGDWGAAFEYADDVIQNGPYELINNTDYVDAWGKQETSESIFDLVIESVSSGNIELFGYVASPEGYGELIATKAFMKLINEDPKDIRLHLFKEDKTSTTEIKSKRFINKYPGRNGALAVNNMRVIRLSDVYLIAAEAALKKNPINQDKANTYLNNIRRRANPEVVDITATETLVLQERRKELVMEGSRFYDVMRLGITVDRMKTTDILGADHFLNDVDLISPSWSDYRTILAIPQAEMDVNTSLVGQQNPGYK